MTRRFLPMILLGAALAATLALTPSRADYAIKDGGGADRTVKSGAGTGGVLIPYSVPVDSTGAPYTSSAGLPVAQQGTWTFGLSGPVPAGSNVIGGVTQSGAWTVGITGALPTGSNAIGSVSVSNLPATQPVSATALPLPTGAATAAKQDTLLTALGTPLQAGGAVSVSNLPATQAISATALPLPAGAATAAKQDTLLTALGTPLQAGGAVSVSNLPATQAISATALPLPTGAATAGKQPALGTAGTASTDVLSVQGIAGGVAIDTVVRGTSTDRGTSVTTAGTAQQLMAANTSRRGLAVQNQSSGNCWINGSATATADYHGLKIPAGALYESPAQHTGTGAISIVCDVATASVYAREF